jgi:hypothetical protein
MTSILYIRPVNKTNPPDTIECIIPHAGPYSFRKDLRLNLWLMVATATYLVALFLRRRHPEWSVAVRSALALAPLVPGLLYVHARMRFISGLDELQRRIQLEAWLFASVGTVLIATAISTVNAAGANVRGLEHGLGLGPAYMSMFVLWLVGTGIANCRYK